ncbi:cell division protein ZapA [Muribaculum sp.]|uniref:cell division protein ZapA n=1 Tax=Muribaculum sp. TaxID=1918611 RepID=UPI0023C2669F|nr:cell division protein ZapA [Muribaculum sp.]MDE5705057.1 cell division protein ZapA [Muribaculum sp.]
MKDKLNITIKVANQRPLRMAVSLGEEEEEVRQAEYFVNHVWAKWMDDKAADQSDSDVLAMTAIYFARLYIQEYRKNEEVERHLASFEETLDKILLDIK